MYTNSCRSACTNNHYFKNAHNIAVVDLLSNDETDYRSDIDHFVSWYVANSLNLILIKTKEIVIYFLSRVYNPITSCQHQRAKCRNCTFL